MKKISPENRRIIEKLVLEFFERVKRPVLVGEVSLYAKRSLEEIETVMNSQVQKGTLRKLSSKEIEDMGWVWGSAAYAVVS